MNRDMIIWLLVAHDMADILGMTSGGDAVLVREKFAEMSARTGQSTMTILRAMGAVDAEYNQGWH